MYRLLYDKILDEECNMLEDFVEVRELKVLK
jgi:hypothetical protein